MGVQDAGASATPAKEPWTSAAGIQGAGEALASGGLKESAKYRVEV